MPILWMEGEIPVILDLCHSADCEALHSCRKKDPEVPTAQHEHSLLILLACELLASNESLIRAELAFAMGLQA